LSNKEKESFSLLFHFFLPPQKRSKKGEKIDRMPLIMRRGGIPTPLLLLISAVLLASYVLHAAAAPDLLLKVGRVEKTWQLF
jgi:hypothetical protein